MEVVRLVVLSALFGEYFLSLLAEVLQYRALGQPLPADFRDTFDDAKYVAAQQYARARSLLSASRATFDLLLLLLAWFALRLFERLDVFVRGVFPSDDPWAVVPRGILYWGALAGLATILDLPHAVYSTFVLEARFGFNNTTVRTFIMDRVKGLMLALVLGPPMGAAVLAFFTFAGDAAWLWVWLALTAFQLLLLFIAPACIMPLFISFTPLEDGPLKRAIHEYASQVGFAFGGIFQVDGSTRSNHSNAFFTGFGATKRIALFDTLIAQTTLPELVAILAHEVGHEKRGHIKQSLAFSVLYLFVMLYLVSLFISYTPLFTAFFVSTPSVYVGLLLFQMLFAPLDTFLQIVLSARSRANEFEADRYSVETYKQPEALISGLKKLTRENLSNLTPHPLYVFLHYSHPPVVERIAAIRRHHLEVGGTAPHSGAPRHKKFWLL